MNNRYKQTKVNGKKELLHRKIMSDFLGRPLLRNEYVHHVDHDKMNNDISNLKIVSPSQHGLEHTKHPIIKNCEVCEKLYKPAKTKRLRQKTCSLECRKKLLSIKIKSFYLNKFISRG